MVIISMACSCTSTPFITTRRYASAVCYGPVSVCVCLCLSDTSRRSTNKCKKLNSLNMVLEAKSHV